jgi:hypothetical protein
VHLACTLTGRGCTAIASELGVAGTTAWRTFAKVTRQRETDLELARTIAAIKATLCR